MMLMMMLGRLRCVSLVLGVLAVLCEAGCTDLATWGGRGAGPNDAPVKSNIIRVNKFFSLNPWLSFSGDPSGKIDGVRFTVYLEDAERPRGVFGTGIIVVEMYRLDRDALGREKPVLIHTWELPPEKAYPWRAKEETAMGWGYGPRLSWGEDLDVAGQQVAFLVKYIREDGRVISSSRQVLKVPDQGAAEVGKAKRRNVETSKRQDVKTPDHQNVESSEHPNGEKE
ncbi:MAG: hypothetical protein JXQ75_07480 [Phycisphaerae bacterium]|nr:hypothetical protein [Phycisphaerae bacterium]